MKLVASGGLLIALSYGILDDGFSKGRALFRGKCDLQAVKTEGWTKVGTPVSFLIPPTFRQEKGRNRWVDGNRSIESAWFGRTGDAAPNMSKACRLNRRTAILDKEEKTGEVWYGVEVLDVPKGLSDGPQYHILLAHGMKTDDALLQGILETARLED